MARRSPRRDPFRWIAPHRSRPSVRQRRAADRLPDRTAQARARTPPLPLSRRLPSICAAETVKMAGALIIARYVPGKHQSADWRLRQHDGSRQAMIVHVGLRLAVCTRPPPGSLLPRLMITREEGNELVGGRLVAACITGESCWLGSVGEENPSIALQRMKINHHHHGVSAQSHPKMARQGENVQREVLGDEKRSKVEELAHLHLQTMVPPAPTAPHPNLKMTRPMK